MKWKTYKKYMLLLMMLCFVVFVFNTSEPTHNFELAENYRNNSVNETGAINAATGIYLDYRVYDSLFESLLLLVSAVGIHYLNKEEKHESKK